MIRSKLKQTLLKMPGVQSIVRCGSRYLAHRRFAKKYTGLKKNTADVFRHHFEANSWGDLESVSGAGSTLRYTENIRKEIPLLVEELGIRTILDVPCGDFNWFRTIQWKTPVSYLGGDIVQPLIERNRSLYEAEGRRFLHLDLVKDSLPHADLWLCRDCLFHLSEREIFLTLDNFLRSEIEFLLTSIHPCCELNTDIPTGWFRFLNLELPPFSLAPPIRRMKDWIEGFPARDLGLWRRESIQQSLASNKAFQRAVSRRR